MKVLSWIMGCVLASVCMGQGTQLPAAAASAATLRDDLARAITRLRTNPDPIVLRSILDGLVREFPGRVVLETYGQSRAGRPLQVLRLQPEGVVVGGTASARPIALMVPNMDRAPNPCLILTQVIELLRNPSRHPDFEVCVVPVPDPDRWMQLTEASDVRLERNFPYGWSPWDKGAGNPGMRPLSEPETRNLLQWILRNEGVMGLLRLQGVEELAEEQTGSLQAYAREVLGVTCVVPSSGETFGLLAGLRVLDERRDRLSGSVLDVQRLAETLWSVDFEIENQGTSEGKGPSPRLHWQVLGGMGKAVAVAVDGEADFTLLSPGATVPVPTPGQRTRVRIVLEETGNDSLFVRFDGARLPALTLAIPLQSPMEPALPLPR